MVIALKIVGLGLLLFCSGFLSGSETALFSLSPLRANKIRQESPRVGEMILRLISNPRRLLISILVGNTFVNVLASALGDSLLQRLFSPHLGELVAIGGMTLLLLIFGEITPKTIAIHSPGKVARRVVPILEWEARLVFPVRKLVRLVTDLVLRVFTRGKSRRLAFTSEEFLTAVRIGEVEGVLDREEGRMIESVVRLSDTTVEALMRPRSEMVTLPITAGYEEVLKLIAARGLSRIPVHGESLDEILGILHVKDLLRVEPSDWGTDTLRQLLREPYFVPETGRAHDLFREFQRRHQHLAVVVDEYGGVAGLITLEDLLEEIVGDIVKIGTDLPEFQWLDWETAVVQGSLPLTEFNERFDVNLASQEVHTVGGYVAARLGRIPSTGERLRIAGLEFRVTQANPQRIEQMIVLVAPGTPPRGNLAGPPDDGQRPVTHAREAR